MPLYTHLLVLLAEPYNKLGAILIGSCNWTIKIDRHSFQKTYFAASVPKSPSKRTRYKIPAEGLMSICHRVSLKMKFNQEDCVQILRIPSAF